MQNNYRQISTPESKKLNSTFLTLLTSPKHDNNFDFAQRRALCKTIYQLQNQISLSNRFQIQQKIQQKKNHESMAHMDEQE